MSASRTNILQKIKQALQQKVPVPFSVTAPEQLYPAAANDLSVVFAEKFSSLQGRFTYCASVADRAKQLNGLLATRGWQKLYCPDRVIRQELAKQNLSLDYTDDLSHCDVAITACEYLVARTGSFFLSSADPSGRLGSVYAPVHICFAHAGQLVHDMDEALLLLREKYTDHLPSLISLATGPSRTADIEKTLVVGVHGPKEVFCFFLDN
ncbi:MAG: lactate utilization protein B/C [Sphingobacteriia bacterium]|jgi:L-lactate dehydrogenase complex protein LldG|nr:MAG: lactate utilization protein B/C [Sphingobacteriia bacterium]